VALAIAVALLTGQRQGDVLSLRWDQIRDGRIYFVQGKTGKELDMGISPQLDSVLEECKALGGKEYVIVSRRGTRYSSCGFRSCFTRLKKKFAAQGLGRPMRFHDLRKMAASGCKDIKSAQELLGHQTPAMTLKHYWMNPDRTEALAVDFDPLAG
jgi:integrase